MRVGNRTRSIGVSSGSSGVGSTKCPSLIFPSPSAPTVLAVNRRLPEQLSALEIYRSPEVRCDGPAPVEARERSLTASPPFPVALAISLLSFLRLWHRGLTRESVRSEAFVVRLEFWLGLTVRYRLP